MIIDLCSNGLKECTYEITICESRSGKISITSGKWFDIYLKLMSDKKFVVNNYTDDSLRSAMEKFPNGFFAVGFTLK